MKVLVAGGGLAGLTAAYRLAAGGCDVKLIEAGACVGGRARSVRQDGYVFDTGAVGIGTCYTAYLALIDELKLRARITPSSTVSGTVRGGRLFELDSARPATLLASKLFTVSSKWKLLTLVRDVFAKRREICLEDVSRAAAGLDDETARAYALRRLNVELADYLIDPMIRALNLSRSDRVSKLELFNALCGLFNSRFVAITGGIDVLPQTLAARFPVTLDTRVTRVSERGAGVEVTSMDARGYSTAETADACVLATLLPQAVEIYPACAPAVGALAQAMRYSRTVCVYLGYARRTQSKALAAFMPTCENAEIALIWLEHNKAPDRAPAGHSIIAVFFDDVCMAEVSARDDAALVRQSAAAVEALFPELAGQRDAVHVTRWAEALAPPDVGLYTQMKAAKAQLDLASRVQLAGDYFSAAGMNAAVVQGNAAAARLLARR